MESLMLRASSALQRSGETDPHCLAWRGWRLKSDLSAWQSLTTRLLARYVVAPNGCVGVRGKRANVQNAEPSGPCGMHHFQFRI
jgi:hypothetical protein